MPSHTPALAEPAPSWVRWVVGLVLLGGSAAMLFTNLGAYPLWGDEADTALFARGVWTTGDTSAVYGDNIYAFRNGLLLDEQLRNRYLPPLSFYLAAPFYGIGGESSAWMRVPFTVCGWLTVSIVVVWLVQSRASTSTWVTLAIAWLCNVSFFLFSRQCRYYPLAMLLSMLVVWLYLQPRRSWQAVLGVSLGLVAIMATHFIAYAAIVVGLLVDYTFWRRDTRLDWRKWLVVLLPQVFAAATFLMIGYHIDREPAGDVAKGNWFAEKATLLVWNLRDLSVCEFGAGLLLVAAPLVGWWRKDPWLVRGVAALLVYVITTTIVSPQPVSITTFADIRYLVPVLPLCTLLSARTLLRITGGRLWLAASLAAFAFGTNISNLPIEPSHWRSTPLAFLHELRQPGYAALSFEIDILQQSRPATLVWLPPSHLPGSPSSQPGISLVHPDTYSLMFHAPDAIYGWQLSDPPPEHLKNQPDVQITGRVPPDRIIMLDEGSRHLGRAVAEAYTGAGLLYDLPNSLLNGASLESTRPELFFHKFHIGGLPSIEQGISSGSPRYTDKPPRRSP